MRIRARYFFCLCLTLTLVVAPLARAESVPPLINYQGRLTDTDSKPVTGTKKLTVNIYDAVSGGNLLWGPQVFPTVPVINGYFNIILGPVETDGSGVALPNGDSINTAFTGGVNCYLQVQVDSEPVTVPRQRILSVPYAVQAETAETAHVATTVVDGAVTGAKIAPTSVDSSHLSLTRLKRNVTAWDIPNNNEANLLTDLRMDVSHTEPKVYLVTIQGYITNQETPILQQLSDYSPRFTYLEVKTYDENSTIIQQEQTHGGVSMVVAVPPGRTFIDYYVGGDGTNGYRLTATLTAVDLGSYVP